MIMDQHGEIKTTLYVDDSIELTLLLVMFGTALWVRPRANATVTKISNNFTFCFYRIRFTVASINWK